MQNCVSKYIFGVHHEFMNEDTPTLSLAKMQANSQGLADGDAYATMLRLSAPSVCDVGLRIMWLNGASYSAKFTIDGQQLM